MICQMVFDPLLKNNDDQNVMSAKTYSLWLKDISIVLNQQDRTCWESWSGGWFFCPWHSTLGMINHWQVDHHILQTKYTLSQMSRSITMCAEINGNSWCEMFDSFTHKVLAKGELLKWVEWVEHCPKSIFICNLPNLINMKIIIEVILFLKSYLMHQ